MLKEAAELPGAPVSLFRRETNDVDPNMDNRAGFFNPFKRLDACRVPRFGPGEVPKMVAFGRFARLLTLWGTPRKKRLGVWFQAFRIAFVTTCGAWAERCAGLHPFNKRYAIEWQPEL
jgi:hypothetical protein